MIILSIPFGRISKEIDNYGGIMMDHNSTMILLSGMFLITWTTFRWKISNTIWDNKLYVLFSYILGSYSIILAIIPCFLKMKVNMIFYIVDFILYLLLMICFVVTKMKKARRGIIKNLQLIISLLIVAGMLVMVSFDIQEIFSGIMGLWGAMVILSTPFEDIQ
ncbi:MAG: hypothetical protein ACI4E1_00680 [Lachnospira sp.]